MNQPAGASRPGRGAAVVTGASSGIGEAFARLVAARGDAIVLVARNGARLERLAAELSDAWRVSTEVLVADLSDPAQVGIVAERLSDPRRPVDLLVNNAGFGTHGCFAELDPDTEVEQIAVNVVALVRLSHVAARSMAARGRGAILNVGSVAGFVPGPLTATYAATKAFVVSFSESLNEELRAQGVTVTCLCPGFTRTGFQERAQVPTTSLPELFWHDAETVARAALDGLARGRAVVVPGWHNQAAVTLPRFVPRVVVRRMAGLVLRGKPSGGRRP